MDYVSPCVTSNAKNNRSRKNIQTTGGQFQFLLLCNRMDLCRKNTLMLEYLINLLEVKLKLILKIEI